MEFFTICSTRRESHGLTSCQIQAVDPLLTNSLATPIAAYSFVAYYSPGVTIETTEHIIYIDFEPTSA